MAGLARQQARRDPFAEGPQQAFLVGATKIEVVRRDQGPDEREAVGVETGGGDPDDGIARPDVAAVDDPVALDGPDAEPGHVERAGVHQPGVLRRLSADQGAAGLATAGRHAADELGDLQGLQPADGDVVEEEQWRGPGADDVVGAHRHEVDPDRVEAPHGRGDRRLRADTVRRRDEDRITAVGRQPDRSGEPAEAADHLRATGRLDGGPDQLDRPLTGSDVDAGPGVGAAELGHRRTAT